MRSTAYIDLYASQSEKTLFWNLVLWIFQYQTVNCVLFRNMYWLRDDASLIPCSASVQLEGPRGDQAKAARVDAWTLEVSPAIRRFPSRNAPSPASDTQWLSHANLAAFTLMFWYCLEISSVRWKLEENVMIPLTRWPGLSSVPPGRRWCASIAPGSLSAQPAAPPLHGYQLTAGVVVLPPLSGCSCPADAETPFPLAA